MAYIDKKITIWERYFLPEDTDLSDVTTEEDAEQLIIDNLTDYELLLETSEDLSVEKNDGAPTIEVYDDDGFIVFENINKK